MEELFQAAELRRNVVALESVSEEEYELAKRGSGWRGQGRPLSIGRGETTRELHDGASLCSPGRWPPERRRLPDNRLLSELREELRRYAAPLPSTSLFARLACGKVNECPFRDLAELRERVYRRFERAGERPRRKPEEDRSPRIQTPGRFLQTDRGSGARSVVLRSRVRGRSRDQHALQVLRAVGIGQQNYASAAELAQTVEDQLVAPVESGQAIWLTEEEARAQYGSKLVVAALEVQVKSGSRDTGDLKIQMLFDGTHGVPVNQNIQVRDQDCSPESNEYCCSWPSNRAAGSGSRSMSRMRTDSSR